MKLGHNPLACIESELEKFKLGVSLVNDGLWMQAQDVFQSLLSNTPPQTKYHVMLSVVCVNTQRYEEALHHLDQALMLEPQAAMLFLQKGQLLKEMEQFELAMDCLQEAFKLDRNNADCAYTLGEVTQHLGLWQTSLEYYDAALLINPHDPHSLNNRGNVLVKLMRMHDAIESYRRAIAINPEFAVAHLNLGNALTQQLDLASAIESFNLAIVLNPKDSVAHYHKGLVLHEQKELTLAQRSLNAAIALDDQVSAYFFSKGLVNLDLEFWLEAVMDFDRALALAPDQINALYNKGLALQKLGDLNAALKAHEEVVERQDDYAEGFYSLGIIHHELNHKALALEHYRRAIELKPDYLEAYTNQGIVLKELNDLEGAIHSYEKAIALNPLLAEPYNNLGNALQQKNQTQRALWCYEKALDLQPDNRFALTNLGNLHTDLLRFDEALLCYDQALALAPHDTDAHWNKALLLLLQGQFKDGWALYEWRWKLSNFDSLKKNCSQPMWDGKTSLQDRTILIHHEQGFGDTIQFCRFVPQLKALGARVVFEIPQALMGILSSLQGVDEWVPSGNKLPAFDTHLPLLSLPARLRIEHMEELMPRPYLHASTSIVHAFSSRLGRQHRPRVGLVWRGNAQHQYDYRRSCRLEDWLAYLPAGVDYHSLQKDPSQEELVWMHKHGDICNWNDSLLDFSQTAGLIKNLDLVLSVDTSVAHLSAALGQETWLLIPKSSDWRWFNGRRDSPWYESLRLFRPQGDPIETHSPTSPWLNVFEQIKSALIERLSL